MMDIKTLLEDEIDILYTTLDRLKIYDIRLSHTKDGRIFAKDADSQWTGKNFYKFLLNDAIVYNQDGTSSVLTEHTLTSLRQLGKHYGAAFPFMELEENPIKYAEMSMEQNYNMIDGIINNISVQEETAKKEEPVTANEDFGVNLICVEDGIDSSKDAGKLMISVLSAVAEIERENIRVQTMEGRIQKAREGKWNGGFAPYGYQLIDGELQINEEEAAAIRVIYDQYVNTDIGSNGIAKYLENHGIRKIQRQNGKNPLFDAHLIRLILKNPVYCGKIAYGRRRTEKVHGTRNDYHLVEQDDYLLVDGLHEAIISEETWQAAQIKLLAQAKKYEHVNKGKDTRTHLLSGIVKCPICGAGMYGNKCIKHKKDGTKYKDFYYYGCKHRTMTRGHKCAYKKQIREELLDDAVAEVIVALVSKPKFASMMQEKINMKVDTSVLDQEIANHEKQLRQFYSIKSKLMEEIDSLDPDDRHYLKRKADLDDRLYRMYDKIEDEESQMIEARAKRQAIEAEKLTGDNIYKVLMYFDKLYSAMNDVERRRVMETLISEIQIYEDRQPNGQWLKSIKFKLPIIEEDMEISLDNDTHVESVTLLVRNDDYKPRRRFDDRKNRDYKPRRDGDFKPRRRFDDKKDGDFKPRRRFDDDKPRRDGDYKPRRRFDDDRRSKRFTDDKPNRRYGK